MVGRGGGLGMGASLSVGHKLPMGHFSDRFNHALEYTTDI